MYLVFRLKKEGVKGSLRRAVSGSFSLGWALMPVTRPANGPEERCFTESGHPLA
jgi:hypothetical protein